MNRRKLIHRLKQGFAFLEMILVVGIVAVLGSVGAVEVAHAAEGLTQKQLDSYAEIIYHAEQSRLAELRTSGRESVYLNADGTAASGLVPYDASFRPSDLTEGDGFQDGEMCCLVMPTAATRDSETDVNLAEFRTLMMPENRDDATLWNGSWVVEFNYKTGMVYSVFFSETDIDYDASDFDPLRFKGGETGRKASKDPKVGYYSSGVANTEQDIVHLTPEVNVINEETLYATFECPVPKDFEDQVVFYYTIVQADGKWSYSGYTDPVSAEEGKYTYNLLLDDPINPVESRRVFFKHLGTENIGKYNEQLQEGFVPGSNMVILLEAAGYVKPTTTSEDADGFNSLFADSSVKERADIKYPRQLQNLDPDTSGVDPIEEAKLLNDIIWPEKAPFTPINNPELKEFDGNEQMIKDLPNSLFAEFPGEEIKDVELVDPVVPGTEINAGALVNNLYPGEKPLTISNVGVHYQDKKPSSVIDTRQIIYAPNAAGGLIGKIWDHTKLDLLDCYAALVVKGNNTAGGLIGELTANTVININNCYADCYVLGGKTGGLIGKGSNTTPVKINNCYAAGYLYGHDMQAGIALCKLQANLGYTVCEFMETDTGAALYATVSEDSGSSALYYLYRLNNNAVGSELSKSDPLGGSFTAPEEQIANAYNLLNQYPEYAQGKPEFYEYPGISTLPHYGDWGPLDKIEDEEEDEEEKDNKGDKATVNVYLEGYLTIRTEIESRASKNANKDFTLVYTIYELNDKGKRTGKSAQTEVELTFEKNGNYHIHECTLSELLSNDPEFASEFAEFDSNGTRCLIEATIVDYTINNAPSGKNTNKFTIGTGDTSGNTGANKKNSHQ